MATLMTRISRVLVMAAIAGAVALAAGCSENRESNAEAKTRLSKKWDDAKVAVQLQMAQQQYEVGDYSNCRDSLDKARAMGGLSAGVELLSAKVDIEKGSLETAAEHLQNSINVNAADPEPFYLMGVVYQRWQKTDSAANYYQQAWDRKTTEVRYMLAVVEMKITMGDLDGAEKILLGRLSTFEQTAAVRIALARIASLRKDYAGAAKYFREAFLLVPDDMGVKRSLAEALFFAGKDAEAATMIEDLREHAAAPAEGDPAESADADRTTLTLMLGQAYLNLHRTADAKSCFQEVIRSHSDNMQAILGLGKVCVETNELPAALAAGKRVLRTDPKSVQAMILVAMVQQLQKQWDDSLTTLETAAAIAPKDSTVLCLEGVGNLKLGKQDVATALFEKAVVANPRDTWASDLLAKVKPATPEAVDTPAQANAPILTNAAPSKAE